MAIPTHIVYLKLADVTPGGTVVSKDDKTTTLNQIKTSTKQFRVIPDPDVPNSVNSPSIKDYIEAEAANDFQLMHLDQTFIITQDLT